MSRVARSLCVVTLWICSQAQAENRVALVIGNSGLTRKPDHSRIQKTMRSMLPRRCARLVSRSSTASTLVRSIWSARFGVIVRAW